MLNRRQRLDPIFQLQSIPVLLSLDSITVFSIDNFETFVRPIPRRLAPCNRVVCASPAYLEKHGEPKHPEDLKKHLGLNYSNVPEGQLWNFLKPDGENISVRVPHRMRANNGDVLLQAALDGLGILATTTFIAYKAVSANLLIPILCDYKLKRVGVYAIYPTQRHLPARVRILIDYLVERFGDKPYWDDFLPV